MGTRFHQNPWSSPVAPTSTVPPLALRRCCSAALRAIPTHRHLGKLTVRYARWDLSSADLWDDALGVVLATIYPVDREANASGFRRPLAPVQSTPMTTKPSGMAPLLRRYVEQHRQTGLPLAYLPKDDLDNTE